MSQTARYGRERKQERGESSRSRGNRWPFHRKPPRAVLGQGTLLFIEGIYRSDFPEVILSKMPVLITSRVLPVSHFTAGWAQAAGDPVCSTGSPIKSSCPREHRHALLVLQWVGLWISRKSEYRARPGVCVCTDECVLSIVCTVIYWGSSPLASDFARLRASCLPFTIVKETIAVVDVMNSLNKKKKWQSESVYGSDCIHEQS